MVYTLRFFSSKCSLFHNSNVSGSCIIHILYTGCAKIKKKIRRHKVNLAEHSFVRKQWHVCPISLSTLQVTLKLCHFPSATHMVHTLLQLAEFCKCLFTIAASTLAVWTLYLDYWLQPSLKHLLRSVSQWPNNCRNCADSTITPPPKKKVIPHNWKT